MILMVDLATVTTPIHKREVRMKLLDLSQPASNSQGLSPPPVFLQRGRVSVKLFLSAPIFYFCTIFNMLLDTPHSLSWMSLPDKTWALTLLGEGWFVIRIAAQLKVTRRTIYKLKTTAENLPPGTLPARKPDSREPRKTSLCTGKVLAREMKEDPSITAISLKEKHLNLLQNVSVRTIQHRLQKELKLPARHAAK
ncbi:hypothetical protein E2C01_052608 [Portunus trituberculatus]|uniref:Transposase Tc1-like domain-containing protein n=1 Tax=Portunus trituberculatus TaxID=210409 RepID=A0A5B7GF34_PORTR|nr:hypothetical protein [Portunus trituberculatus]